MYTMLCVQGQASILQSASSALCDPALPYMQRWVLIIYQDQQSISSYVYSPENFVLYLLQRCSLAGLSGTKNLPKIDTPGSEACSIPLYTYSAAHGIAQTLHSTLQASIPEMLGTRNHRVLCVA